MSVGSGFLAGVVCVFALTGCTETFTDMTVGHGDRGGVVNGTQSHTVDLAAVAELAAATGDQFDPEEVQGEAVTAFDRETVDSSLDRLGLTAPHSIVLEPMTVGDKVGWRATYTDTPLRDYAAVSAELVDLAGGAAVASSAADADTLVPDLSLPAVEEFDGGYRVSLANPFHTVPGAVTGPTSGLPARLADAAAPNVDVTLRMPAKIGNTNTPDAVAGAVVEWNNDTLRAASGEAVVFVESAPDGGFLFGKSEAYWVVLSVVCVGVLVAAVAAARPGG